VHEVGNPCCSADVVVKRALSIVGLVVGLYFVVRAVVEPFNIDITDPATYRNDWGGPSLAGVLAVHCGPGVLAATIIAVVLLRRCSRRRRRAVKVG
jgi:hypothetical protein